MNTPCFAKTVFGPVETRPSAPPSLTVTWPSSQIDRLASGTEPGTTASAVVVMLQVDPMVVDAGGRATDRDREGGVLHRPRLGLGLAVHAVRDPQRCAVDLQLAGVVRQTDLVADVGHADRDRHVRVIRPAGRADRLVLRASRRSSPLRRWRRAPRRSRSPTTARAGCTTRRVVPPVGRAVRACRFGDVHWLNAGTRLTRSGLAPWGRT